MEWFLATLIAVWSCLITIIDCKKPNIIFFMTDDWGFNDVGYHQNTDTSTPYIDHLAVHDSLMIEKYYAYPLCSITRAAFLTGRYPMRFGMQDAVVSYESDYALTKTEVLLSQEFQAQGYTTHIIGKWHLGTITWDYTPTYRGFDSFLGYYGGALYYYDHYGDDENYDAFDLRQDTYELSVPYQFSLNIWTNRAEDIIEEFSNQTNPFFLYVAWQGSHSPSEYEESYYEIYANGLTEQEQSDNEDRLAFQAQTTQTDTALNSIIKTLKETNQWDDTLLVFCSDNGAYDGYGDNSPLRGEKTTIWEGGIRLPAFITGGYLSEKLRGKTFDSYPLHATDWYQTLLTAAGLSPAVNEKKFDGEDLWSLLQTASKVTSSSYEYALDEDAFLNGENRGINDDYIANGGFDAKRDLYDKNLYDGDLEELLSKTDERIMLVNADSNECATDVCGALIYGGRWKVLYGAAQLNTCGWERTFENSTNDILGCGGVPSDANSSCYCTTEICLFDLLNDPCEYYNVADEYSDKTQLLYNWLKEFYDEQVTPLVEAIGTVDDSIVDPTNADGSIGFWGPWNDETDWTQLKFEKYIANNSDDSSDSGSEGDNEDEEDVEIVGDLQNEEKKEENKQLDGEVDDGVDNDVSDGDAEGTFLANYFNFYIANSNQNPHFFALAIGIVLIVGIIFCCICPFCKELKYECINALDCKKDGNDFYTNWWTYSNLSQHYLQNNNKGDVNLDNTKIQNNCNENIGVNETSPLMIKVKPCDDLYTGTELP